MNGVVIDNADRNEPLVRADFLFPIGWMNTERMVTIGKNESYDAALQKANH